MAGSDSDCPRVRTYNGDQESSRTHRRPLPYFSFAILCLQINESRGSNPVLNNYPLDSLTVTGTEFVTMS
jgi:hypothetical protein